MPFCFTSANFCPFHSLTTLSFPRLFTSFMQYPSKICYICISFDLMALTYTLEKSTFIFSLDSPICLTHQCLCISTLLIWPGDLSVDVFTFRYLIVLSQLSMYHLSICLSISLHVFIFLLLSSFHLYCCLTFSSLFVNLSFYLIWYILYLFSIRLYITLDVFLFLLYLSLHFTWCLYISSPIIVLSLLLS